MEIINVLYLILVVLGTVIYGIIARKEYLYFNSGEYKFGVIGVIVPTLAYVLFLVVAWLTYGWIV